MSKLNVTAGACLKLDFRIVLWDGFYMASLIDTKYGRLSRFEIYNTFAIKRDIDWLNELLHDDFMYVQD